MQKEVPIWEDYLYLPIQLEKDNKEKKDIIENNMKETDVIEKLFEIFILDKEQERKILEIYIPVGIADSSVYAYDYLARFPVKQFTDKTIVVKGDAPEAFFDEVKNGSYLASKPMERPLHHLTAEYGWLNDPNGLLFDGENYHAYFQHNPCNTKWNNMSWGHAISKDLLHWKHQDDVLFPDENGMAFSGCGLINEKGLLNLPKDAYLFYYTAAGDTMPWCRGKMATQRLAYSLNKGNTLMKERSVFLDTISWENRDPKIFYHTQTKAYIMVLWLEKNEFGILRSNDLRSWKISDKITLTDAWECPDLLSVPCADQPDLYQWMFWSADGFYYWGDFDGYQFQTDGIKHQAYLNQVPYAAQSISGTREVISIPWLRLEHKNRLYKGAMGIPRVLSFAFENGEKVLLQNPIGELKKQAKQCVDYERVEENVRGNAAENVEEIIQINHKATVIVDIKLDGRKCLDIVVNHFKIHYDAKMEKLTAGQEVYQIGERDEFSFLIDDTIFELTAGHGIITGVFELPDNKMDILILKNQILSYKAYELE